MKKYFYLSIILIYAIVTFKCTDDTPEQSSEELFDSRNLIINAADINKKIKKGKDIEYRNATIIGDLIFLASNEKNLLTPQLVKHEVNSSVIFYNCTFKGNIIAHRTYTDHSEVSEFNKNLTFIECTFQDTVNFTSSDFNDLVNFSGSDFHEFVTFESSCFNYRKNYFDKVRFYKNAMFNLMKVNGNISFFEAIFDDNVIFQLSKFNDPVQFGAAKFNKNSVFSSVKFYDDVFFNYAEFHKKAIFNQSVFKGRAEFIKSKFNHISEFKNCMFFGRTIYNNSDLTGVFTFEGSDFLFSEPPINEFNIKEGSDFIGAGNIIQSKY